MGISTHEMGLEKVSHTDGLPAVSLALHNGTEDTSTDPW